MVKLHRLSDLTHIAEIRSDLPRKLDNTETVKLDTSAPDERPPSGIEYAELWWRNRFFDEEYLSSFV